MVDAEAVREFNRLLLHRGANYVVVSKEHDDPTEIEQQIRDVPATAIHRILRAIDPFPIARAEQKWAQFMAVSVSQQLWPDGNHRTSLLTYNAAMKKTIGARIFLPEETVAPLLTGSKEILQQDPVPPGQPVFPIRAVKDQEHPLHAHFRRCISDLEWEQVE